MTEKRLKELLNQESEAYAKFLKTCKALLDAEDKLKALHDPIIHAGGKPHDRMPYHADIVDACGHLLTREKYQERLRGQTK